MGNLMQRHIPDDLARAVGQRDITLRICLHHAHISTRKIGNQHAKGNGNEEQRLILLDNAKIEEDEREQIHDDERRISHDAAYSGHRIEFVENFVYHIHVLRINSYIGNEPCVRNEPCIRDEA